MGQNKLLVGMNGLLFLVVLGISVLVDGNGRIAGLDGTISKLLTIVLFAVATAVAGLLIAQGKGRERWLGGMLAAFYVAMMVPGLL